MTLLDVEKEYYSIGEAAEIAGIEPYILRYWENEFRLIRPVRRPSGHRKYARKDVDSILRIKDLLYVKGFTIAGAKKLLAQNARSKPEQEKLALEDQGAAVELLEEAKSTLEEIVRILA